MAKFLTPLDARQLSDTNWELLDDLVYTSDLTSLFYEAHPLSVPKGFVTDFASVPRVPLAYLLAGGTGNAAAVVHDFLYQTHLVPKSVADNIFYEALRVLNEPRWRAWMMYNAVVLLGQSHYDTGPSRFKVLNP